MLYMPVFKLLPEWFSERRGLAGGIIFSGNGVGGFVFPFMINSLLGKVGLRWTLRILAISTSLCSAIVLPAVRSRFPIPKFSPTQRRPKLIPPQMDWFWSPLFMSFVSHLRVDSRVALHLTVVSRWLRHFYRVSRNSRSPYTSPCSQGPCRIRSLLRSSLRCSTCQPRSARSS